MERLGAAGFSQYEISNHAQPGCESSHNRAYWLGSDYLGFGPSAFSTVGLTRWENIRNTAEYTSRVLGGKKAAEFREELTPAQRAGETAAFRIRMREGIPLTELAPWTEDIARFESIGLIERSGESIRLTTRGKLLADSVAEIFIA